MVFQYHSRNGKTPEASEIAILSGLTAAVALEHKWFAIMLQVS
jgi:hypothetical protein